jgi:hypothetical protein
MAQLCSCVRGSAPDVRDAEHELELAVAARDRGALADEDAPPAVLGVRELRKDDAEAHGVKDHAGHVLEGEEDGGRPAHVDGALAEADRGLHGDEVRLAAVHGAARRDAHCRLRM